MKKKLAVLLTATTLSLSLMACTQGNQADNSAADASAQGTSAAADGASASAADGASTAADDVEAMVDGLETITLEDIKASDYVTLGQYDGITVEVAPAEVSDEQVEDYINNTLTQNTPNLVEVTDRAVQQGDTVNIDYVGKYADTQEAFDGGTAQGASLGIGSHSYIDGFEDGLVGVKKGETVDLNLTFPENYGAADLAGKDVVFTVTVNNIYENGTELTDEWAKSVGYEGVETLDQLRDKVRENLTADAESNYDSELKSNVVKAVQEQCEFKEMPEKLVNRFMQEQMEQFKYYANMYAMYYGQQLTPTDVITMMAQSEGFTGTAEEYLKHIGTEMTEQYVMFKAIADEQGISITDEEIDTYLKDRFESAASTAYSTYEDFKATQDLEIYREGLMTDEVIERLTKNANVVEPTE